MPRFQSIKQFDIRPFLCCLTFYALAAAPTFGQIINHEPLFTFEGNLPANSGDSFGFSVSDAGDVNGDGTPDVIVGAHGTAGSGLFGTARVFSGVDGSLLYKFVGEEFLHYFGEVVSGAGDVNGDGFADLIVSRSADGLEAIGAQVFSGVDGSLLYEFEIDAFEGQGIGAGAGDVNGDGFADLIVGSPDGDGGFFFNGSAQVYSGFDGSLLYSFNGDEPLHGLGASVSSAGDVNGDGFDDVIVGAPALFSGQPGYARVFSGFDGSVLYTFEGDIVDDTFGSSVSGAGDVNGDGFADVIVGATSFSMAVDGYARVFSGADGSILYNLEGNGNRVLGVDGFGTSVSGAGDVNGDGFSDLIVGDLNDNSNGTVGGSAQVFSGFDGSVIYAFDGDTNDGLGFSVSSAGDINGDGIADLIVGAPGNTTHVKPGYARVYVSQVVLLGDVNLDGVVNFLDIPAFIEVLQGGNFQIEADCNQDGVVDFLDIPAFIEILSNQ